MSVDVRNPTSEVAVTGTWSGTSRYSLVNDQPDTTGASKTTCSAAGVLTLGFSAFAIPAGSTGISVAVAYYDSKNGSQASSCGALLRCNDTTNRLASAHNPANATFTLRTDTWANNPKSGVSWTVNDVNGVGTNGLTAFGLSVTDASPTVDLASIQLQVSYTPPAFSGSGAPSLQKLTASGTATAAAPSFSAAGASILQKLTASGAASAQSLSFSAAGASVLLKLATSGVGSATVPSFSAAASPSLKKLTASAAASSTVPAFSGAGAALLAKLSAASAASGTVPNFSANGVATLKKLTAAIDAGSTVPSFSSTAAATLPKLAATGAAAESAPSFSATAVATLPKLGASAAAAAANPGTFLAACGATLPKLSATGMADCTVPEFVAAGAATLPKLSTLSAANDPGPDVTAVADITLNKIACDAIATFYPGLPVTMAISAATPLILSLRSRPQAKIVLMTATPLQLDLSSGQ